MLKVSTGLRNAMLDTAPLRDALDLGFLKLYSGTEPATADADLGAAVLLVTISVNVLLGEAILCSFEDGG